jgi:hypothetical protein
MEIEKVSLAVQIKGKPYFVALDSDKLHLLIQMAQGLSDNGKINVIPAPEGFEFKQIKDI